MTHKSDRVLSVQELARVEGEGALYLRARGDRVEEARLDIYEPPRFFEAFLRGRAYTEPPDITARICGICPVAYQMSACLALEEALRLIEAYEPPDPPAVEVPPRAGTGHGVTEAPRGTLYHRYEIGADGLITTARIVPPTSQNQAAIEADLRAFAEARLGLDDAELTRQCEQAIRNYDPCISCSAHFLDLTVKRSLFIPNGAWFPCQVLASSRSW
jgi:coenzyme F420-reducing hydrogenase alpha subunit